MSLGGLGPLPAPAERRLAVRVTADALRQLRGGHPWVYDGSITSHSHDGAPGDLAVVFDDKRRFAAIGLWDPHSPIRLRVLHHGRPETIDDGFWITRLEAAEDRRRPLLDDPAVTGIRLVHGENDRLPGLIIDRYDTTLVVKLYTPAWFPHLPAVVAAALDRWRPTTIVVRLARNVPPPPGSTLHDGCVIHGPLPDGTVAFLENGHTMQADPVEGQKTGYFLDQRANRRRVGELAAGGDVLDVFCCHGGFSVHAAAGGAASVHLVDLSPHAISAAERHLTATPKLARVPRRSTVGDAFTAMADLASSGSRYDLVVVDPPAFASRADQVDGARRAYARLTELAVPLVRPGGLLVQASCSSRIDLATLEESMQQGAARAGAVLDISEHTGHDIDHPIGFAQGAYLDAVYAQVRAVTGRRGSQRSR